MKELTKKLRHDSVFIEGLSNGLKNVKGGEAEKMKRKRKIIGALMMISVLLSGCTGGRNLPDPEVPKQGSTKQENVKQEEEVTSDVGGMSETVGGDSALGGLESLKIDTEKVNRMLEEFGETEKILDVMLPKEEMLLLQCMNRESEELAFYTLCLKEGEECIQPITLPLAGEVDCYTYEDCIVLYDTMNHILVLNYQLDIVNEIMIPEFIQPIRDFGERRNYCVLPRSQRILYYETVLGEEFYVGLFETDYTCKEKQLVYRLDGPETNLDFLNGFCEICPGYSQKGVFFTGDYYETVESQSKDCVGYLDLETKEIAVRKTESNCMELISAGAVFYDGYRENDREYAGKLLFIDETGAASWLVTKYFKESERVSGGPDGYVLTCYEGENGEGVLNLYKEKLWEKQVVVPKEPADFLLLNLGQHILLSYRSQNGLEISFLDTELQVSTEQEKQTLIEESPFSPEAIEGLGEALQVFYGWTVANYDSSLKNIDFGEKKSVDLMMEIESTHACEVGYMIFVDGIPQRYRMGEQEGYVIPVGCEKGISYATLEFSPVVSERKKEHTVIFACMFHPNFRVSEEDMNYGNYHRISQLLPWTISGDFSEEDITISTDVEYRPLTEEIKEQHTRINRDGTVVKQYESTLLSMFCQNGKEAERFTGGENTQLVLYGGDERTYRVSLFVDHQPIAAFSGAEYVDVAVKKDQMAVIDLDLSEAEISDYSCLYAILWSDSMKDEEKFIVEKTESITLFH